MTGTERVRAYYEALNTGDAAAVSAHFTEDATHYYTRLGPHQGAKTIGDRGAEWFGFHEGKIAEVRAYHHGGKKNPQGDLLGFDHEGRGYRVLAAWEAPASKESAA